MKQCFSPVMIVVGSIASALYHESTVQKLLLRGVDSTVSFGDDVVGTVFSPGLKACQKLVGKTHTE